MNRKMDKNFRRVAGKLVSLKVRFARRSGVAVATRTSTLHAEFEKVRHLLSDKPLRRPNRTRPLDR